MYRVIFTVLMRRLDPERAHHLGFRAIRTGIGLPLAGALVRRYTRPAPVLRQRLWDLEFPAPLGLAAGFDKDGLGPQELGALGFGFIEVGTVTAQAQPGNPLPRLFRLVADRAIVNRMGFNNGGARAAAARLAALPERTQPVGVNIGKTKIVEEAHACEDYAASAMAVAAVADYVVVNVSSPNTPGLRSLQAVDALRPILATVREALDVACPSRHVPLLVKIAPDLADEDIDAVAGLCLELALDGIIATNTTIARTGLRTPAEQVQALGAGGLSGPVLKERSMQVLHRLRKQVGNDLVIISVGGVESAQDVWERLCAGASLVQGYTAFIYAGPFWAARVHRQLAARLRAAGASGVADVIGSAGQ